jgi:DNA-binding SARP family transcriptional activator
MSRLSVTLFGRFAGDVRGQALRLDNNKVQELLSYLLLYHQRPHERLQLASTLWEDVPVGRAKGYLRKALWQLQRQLQAACDVEHMELLLVEPDWIQVNEACDLQLDVMCFEQAFERSQGTAGRDLDGDQASRLQAAVELYKGDLLEGWYQEWCLYERQRLQRMYIIMLDKLLDYCEANEAYESALIYGMRILKLDQARERTHRCLMRIYYASGDRTEALRQYDRCLAILKKELDVGPSEQTVALYHQIQNEALGDSQRPVAALLPPPPAEALQDNLAHLLELETALSNARQQVRLQIQNLEALLSLQHG